MINLLSFYFNNNFLYKHKDSLNHIIFCMRIHIDHLQHNGWKPQDIIIKSNFEFNHNGIASQPFLYNNLTNLFFSKIIAAYEVLIQNPDQVVWSHDHDTYQIKPFNQHELDKILTHDITMCRYWQDNYRPQGASVFYKYLSPTLKDIYNLIITNPKYSIICNDDEILFQTLIHENLECQKNISLDLPFEYNTSITKFTRHRRTSNDPYCLHGDPFGRCRQFFKQFSNLLD